MNVRRSTLGALVGFCEARADGWIEQVAFGFVAQEIGEPGAPQACQGDMEAIFGGGRENGLAGPSSADESAERDRTTRIAHAI